MSVNLRALLDVDHGVELGLRFFAQSNPSVQVGADKILNQDAVISELYTTAVGVTDLTLRTDYWVTVHLTDGAGTITAELATVGTFIGSDGGTFTIGESSTDYDPSPPLVSEPAAITTEFTDLAIELIDEFIPTPNAVWVRVSDNPVPDPSKPYVVTKSTTQEFPVRILFVQDDLEDRQLLKYRKDTQLVNGQVNGYMYAYEDFTPQLKDVVEWNGQTLTVAAIDPIQPIDEVILYFIEFKL